MLCFIDNGGSGLYMIYVSCCVVFTMAVVDSIFVMLCCIYSGVSGFCILCCVVLTMTVVDYTCMLHALFYLQ